MFSFFKKKTTPDSTEHIATGDLALPTPVAAAPTTALADNLPPPDFRTFHVKKIYFSFKNNELSQSWHYIILVPDVKSCVE